MSKLTAVFQTLTTGVIIADDVTDVMYYLKVPFSSEELKLCHLIFLSIRPLLIFVYSLVCIIRAKQFKWQYTAIPFCIYSGTIQLFEQQYTTEKYFGFTIKFLSQTVPLLVIQCLNNTDMERWEALEITSVVFSVVTTMSEIIEILRSFQEAKEKQIQQKPQQQQQKPQKQSQNKRKSSSKPPSTKSSAQNLNRSNSLNSNNGQPVANGSSLNVNNIAINLNIVNSNEVILNMSEQTPAKWHTYFILGCGSNIFFVFSVLIIYFFTQNGSCNGNQYQFNAVCKYCSTVVPYCSECSFEDSFNCTTCDSGYYLDNQKCKKCSLEISSCFSCEYKNDKLGCTKCFDSYFTTYESQCESCTILDQRCTRCEFFNGKLQCTNCAQNYFPTADSTCVTCSDISNCNSCKYNYTLQNVQCLQCQSGYGLYNHKCISCSSITNCTDCLFNGQLQCLKCEENSILDYEGVCKLKNSKPLDFTSWRTIGSGFQSIQYGPSAKLWGIKNRMIYYYDSIGKGWLPYQALSSMLTIPSKFAVDKTNLVFSISYGSIYVYYQSDWKLINTENKDFLDIKSGADGSIWAIRKNSTLYQFYKFNKQQMKMEIQEQSKLPVFYQISGFSIPYSGNPWIIQQSIDGSASNIYERVSTNNFVNKQTEINCYSISSGFEEYDYPVIAACGTMNYANGAVQSSELVFKRYNQKTGKWETLINNDSNGKILYVTSYNSSYYAALAKNGDLLISY